MNTIKRKLYPLAAGGVTLGFLQSIEAIDFNGIWFQILYSLLNTLISALLGSSVSSTADTGLGGLFGGLFA